MLPTIRTIQRLFSKFRWAILGLAALLAMAPATQAQPRPYIGFVYPAGGQQGTTFRIRLGGQGLDGDSNVQISGKGVRAKIVEYLRRMNPQDMALLREQLKEFKQAQASQSRATA